MASMVSRAFFRAWRYLRRSSLIDMGKFLLVLAVLTWLLARGSERTGYHWQWYRVPRYIASIDGEGITLGPLIEGALVTLRITAISLPLAFFWALVTALFRLSGSPLARSVARVYLEVIRNTPLLVQLLFVYFVLSPIVPMGRFSSAILALSLFEGAYGSEIIRAGILSIPKGQWEAADSLGLSKFHTYRYIILPQAFRKILPPLSSQAISLIKDSALVSILAIYDLTMQGQSIIAETYLTFEIWFTVAGIYLMITVSVSVAIQVMEKRLRVDASFKDGT